jgi:hypothetical protein
MNKNILKLMMVFVALVAFNACSEDDDIRFTTQTPPDQITFTNDFLSEYLLSSQTAQNNAERFTWEAPDFGVPTPITYQLEGSIDFEFTEPIGLAETSNKQASVSVRQLLNLATAAGLDNDPETENPNTGDLYFRVRAMIGSENADNSPMTISEITTLTVTLIEASAAPAGNCDLPALFIVGAGAPDAGWGWNSPVEIMCTGNDVYTTNVLLDSDGDANFRFFTENGNWDSGINYPGFIDEGFTIDERFEDAEDGDNNFLFIGDTGFYRITVDYDNMTISLSDPEPQGDCGEVDAYWLVGAGVPDAGWGWNSPEIVPCDGDGIYKSYVRFSSDAEGNNFRFFTENGNWDSGRNYPYFIDEGYTIDERFEDAEDGDNNFAFIGTDGSYVIIVDTNEKTITLQ